MQRCSSGVGSLAPRPRQGNRQIEGDVAVAEHDDAIGQRHCLADVTG